MDHSDEEGDSEEIIVIKMVVVVMWVMGVKTFFRSGRVAEMVEAKDGSTAKSFHFWLKKEQKKKTKLFQVSQRRAKIH